MTRDQVYLRHILESIERIDSYASVGKEEYLKNTHWQDAIIRNFEVIGEVSKRLSEEFKKRNAQVPWRSISGLRNVLIHDYLGVDLNAVWQVIENDLPGLKKTVQDNLE